MIAVTTLTRSIALPGTVARVSGGAETVAVFGTTCAAMGSIIVTIDLMSSTAIPRARLQTFCASPHKFASSVAGDVVSNTIETH